MLHVVVIEDFAIIWDCVPQGLKAAVSSCFDCSVTSDLSRRATVLCSMSCKTAERPRLWNPPRPPPQLRQRARSLPVPRGKSAIAGGTHSSLPMLACTGQGTAGLILEEALAQPSMPVDMAYIVLAHASPCKTPSTHKGMYAKDRQRATVRYKQANRSSKTQTASQGQV